MTDKCIGCGKTWEKYSTYAWPKDITTGSICCQCFKKIATKRIRRRQLKEGYSPCFNQYSDKCPNRDCKYYVQCQCEK